MALLNNFSGYEWDWSPSVYLCTAQIQYGRRFFCAVQECLIKECPEPQTEAVA